MTSSGCTRSGVALALAALAAVGCGAALASSPPTQAPERSASEPGAEPGAESPPEASAPSGLVAQAAPEDTCHLGYHHRWDPYRRIQDTAMDLHDFLSLNRRELARTCPAFADVRVRMVQKVAQYRDAPAVPILIELLDEAPARLREVVAEALAAIGPPEATPARDALRRRLDDPAATPEERRAIEEALRAIEAPSEPRP